MTPRTNKTLWFFILSNWWLEFYLRQIGVTLERAKCYHAGPVYIKLLQHNISWQKGVARGVANEKKSISKLKRISEFIFNKTHRHRF